VEGACGFGEESGDGGLGWSGERGRGLSDVPGLEGELLDLGREGFGGSTGFDAAEGGAAIVTEAIAVVTGFGGEIDDTVAAAGEGAIGTAGGIGGVTVLPSSVALLTGLKEGIAAEDRVEAAGTGVAGDPLGESKGEGGFAGFAAEALEDAVTTGALFEEALGGAAIGIAEVLVVTFLPFLEDAVAAGDRDGAGEEGGDDVGDGGDVGGGAALSRAATLLVLRAEGGEGGRGGGAEGGEGERSRRPAGGEGLGTLSRGEARGKGRDEGTGGEGTLGEGGGGRLGGG
jgi:hypothetical protein